MTRSGKAVFKSKSVAYAFSADCRALGYGTDVVVVVDDAHYRIAGYKVYWSNWATNV